MSGCRGADTIHSSVRNYWPCEISSYTIESHLRSRYFFFHTKYELFSLFFVAGDQYEYVNPYPTNVENRVSS